MMNLIIEYVCDAVFNRVDMGMVSVSVGFECHLMLETVEDFLSLQNCNFQSFF